MADGPRVAPRWEVGSEFHLLLEPEAKPTPPPWGQQALLLGTGRSALQVLLAHGQRTRGWRRVWLPSYLCAEVHEAARATGLAVRTYPCAPFGVAAPSGLRAGASEAVLQVHYFGLGAVPPAPELAGAERIEDHTHDPWAPAAYASTADFCIASLRKTLPLPDGGVLWSPAAHPLPQQPAPCAGHLAVAAQKLSAMALKALYLAGGAVDKATFRRLAVEAEQRIGAQGASAMSEVARALLGSLPVMRWRAARRNHHHTLRSLLAGVPGLRVAPVEGAPGCSPLGAVLLFDSVQLRERVRSALLAASVYPAILWPLDAAPGVGEAERALGHTLLVLPCDMRYGVDSLERVAAHVRAAVLQRPASAAPARSVAP
jgi:hypothetical protein